MKRMAEGVVALASSRSAATQHAETQPAPTAAQAQHDVSARELFESLVRGWTKGELQGSFAAAEERPFQTALLF